MTTFKAQFKRMPADQVEQAKKVMSEDL